MASVAWKEPTIEGSVFIIPSLFGSLTVSGGGGEGNRHLKQGPLGSMGKTIPAKPTTPPYIQGIFSFWQASFIM